MRPPAQGMHFRWCVLSLLACLRMHLSILWSGWIAWWCARPRRPPSPCSPRSTVGVAGSGGTGGRPPSRGDTAWPWPVRRGGQTPAGQWENGRHVTNGKKRDRVAAGSSHHTAGEAAVEDPTSRRDPARGVVNRRRQRWETPPPPGWAGGSATAWRALTTHAPPHRPPPTTPSPSRRRTRTRAPHTHAHRGVASRGQTDGMGGGPPATRWAWVARRLGPPSGRAPRPGVGRPGWSRAAHRRPIRQGDSERSAGGCPTRPPGPDGGGRERVRPPPRRQVSNVRSGGHRRPSRRPMENRGCRTRLCRRAEG